MKPIATAILILLVLIIFLFFAVRNANRQNLVPTGSDAPDIKESAGMGGETIMLFFILYLVTLCIFSFFSVKGQNLVPNGDFEQYSGCPTSQAQIDSALFWTSPILMSTGSTPDYYNQCSTGSVNVPNASYGYQQAHSGGAFCGIALWALNYNDAREFIEVPLTSPLVANQCYHFEMYINSANIYGYSSDDIAAYFSDTLISGFTNYNPLPFTPQINNTTGNFPDTLSWMLVSGDYTASGGESYLIIGNYKWDINTNTIIVNSGGSDYVYVYIDDISLVQIPPCNTALEEQNQNDAIKIYPNPVTDEFQVSGFRFPVGEKTELSIYDMKGRKVFEQTLIQSSLSSGGINIQSLNSGIYFIEINTGKDIYRKKFLKEN